MSIGYFTATNRWGYPRNVREIVEKYENGSCSLETALETMGNMFSCTIGKENALRGGKAKEVTVINFGCPIVATFIFN